MSATILKRVRRFTSTFTDLPIKLRFIGIFAGLTAGVFFAGYAFASEAQFASPYLNEALSAHRSGLKKRSHYFAARYLGKCQVEPDDTCREDDFKRFLQQRKLSPKAFIPGDWDPEFIKWFEEKNRVMWGVDGSRIREKQRSFEITSGIYQDKYFATVVASPELELWHLMEKGMVTRPIVLAVASYLDKPTLFFGKLLKGKVSFQFSPLFLQTQKRNLVHIYRPAFHDIDQDAVPEVWFRYNTAWGNGFAQYLEVYRIQDERELKLLHRFEGLNEGFARRLNDNRVEVGRGSTSKKGMSRMEQDIHEVDVYQFKDGKFTKLEEKKVPFLMKSPEWKDYYTETG